MIIQPKKRSKTRSSLGGSLVHILVFAHGPHPLDTWDSRSLNYSFACVDRSCHQGVSYTSCEYSDTPDITLRLGRTNGIVLKRFYCLVQFSQNPLQQNQTPLLPKKKRLTMLIARPSLLPAPYGSAECIYHPFVPTFYFHRKICCYSLACLFFGFLNAPGSVP